jgi:DNA-binding CsgD family transcriptional regulator
VGVARLSNRRRTWGQTCLTRTTARRFGRGSCDGRTAEQEGSDLQAGNVQLGQSHPAVAALERLLVATSASGTDWACAIEARCRALLSQGEAAETLYREAIERFAATPLRFDIARAQLLYGEWLRRDRRPKDARDQLRAAYGLFAELGLEGFTERAGVELRAAGEQPPTRTVETRTHLTPQEAQISQLVALGATNPEIAEQLFISPSTVEYHLNKVFKKLGVKSRIQLARHILEPKSPP